MSSVQQKKKKNTRHTKNRKVWPIQRGKKKQSTETVPAKDLTAHTLDKNFTVTVLKKLKELNNDVKKVKQQCMSKWKYQQSDRKPKKKCCKVQ